MWRFALRNNIRRLRSLLVAGTPGNEPALLQGLLDEAETELRDLENASAHELVRQNDALRLFAQKAVDDAIELLHAQFGNLQIYDHSTNALIMVAQRNFRKPFLDYFAVVISDEESACGRCLATGERVVIEDVDNDPSFVRHLPIARETGFRAVQSTPLCDHSGRFLGVISTHFHEPRRFTAHDHEAMDRFAPFIATGLAPLLASDQAQFAA